MGPGSSLCVFLFQMKRLVGSDQETLRIHERLVAGSLAGAIAQSSIYPMEVRVTWVLEWAVHMGHRGMDYAHAFCHSHCRF